MERHSCERVPCRLHELNGIGASITPVVLKPNELNRGKPIIVHQSPQRRPNLCFYRDRHGTGWVGRVAVLRLVLDRDGVEGNAVVLEPLEGFEEVVRIWNVEEY